MMLVFIVVNVGRDGLLQWFPKQGLGPTRGLRDTEGRWQDNFREIEHNLITFLNIIF